jgi:hypothetical protein
VTASTLAYDFSSSVRVVDGLESPGSLDSRLTPSLEPGLPKRGPYDLGRIDAGAFVAFHHPFLEPGIEVRRISYSQDPLSQNNYDATIVLFRLTRRFDF